MLIGTCNHRPLCNRRSKFAGEFDWWHAVGHKRVLLFRFCHSQAASRACNVCAMPTRETVGNELVVRGASQTAVYSVFPGRSATFTSLPGGIGAWTLRKAKSQE